MRDEVLFWFIMVGSVIGIASAAFLLGMAATR